MCLALLRWWADGKRWGLRAIRVDSSRPSDVQKTSVCFSLMNALLWLVSVFDIFLFSSVKFHDFHQMDDKTGGRIPRTEKRPEESDFVAFVQTMIKTESWQTDGKLTDRRWSSWRHCISLSSPNAEKRLDLYMTFTIISCDVLCLASDRLLLITSLHVFRHYLMKKHVCSHRSRSRMLMSLMNRLFLYRHLWWIVLLNVCKVSYWHWKADLKNSSSGFK